MFSKDTLLVIHTDLFLQLSEDYTKEERERHTKVMEDFKNRYCPALRAAQGAAVPREGKRRQVGLDLSSQFLPRHTHTPPPSIYACWNFLILEEHDMIDMISSVSVYITADDYEDSTLEQGACWLSGQRPLTCSSVERCSWGSLSPFLLPIHLLLDSSKSRWNCCLKLGRFWFWLPCLNA